MIFTVQKQRGIRTKTMQHAGFFYGRRLNLPGKCSFLWKALESPGKVQSLNHCIKKSKLSMSAAARPAGNAEKAIMTAASVRPLC